MIRALIPSWLPEAWLTRPPPVARSGRTLLIVGTIGLLFALTQLAGSWQLYRDPTVVLGFWVLMSLMLVAMAWGVSRLGGAVTGRTVIPMIVLLVVADVLVPAQTMTGRIGNASWNWGVVAILILALAVYRPVLEVVLLCLAHAGAVVAWAAVSTEAVNRGAVVLTAAGAVIPPLVAAQFVNFYVGILSEREEAGLRAAQIEASKIAEAAVEHDSQRRLARIRAEVVPVLRYVIAGAPIPLDVEHADAARRAAARLRSQLLEGRDVAWLLSGSRDDDPVIEVRVVSDAGARRVLDDDLRSALASLVSLLRRHQPWDQFAVTLTARQPQTPRDHAQTHNVTIQPGQPSILAVTVVATGDCIDAVARDPAIHTAARRLGAALTVVDERIVVVEGAVEVLAVPAGADIV
jgi:hypothetical protein